MTPTTTVQGYLARRKLTLNGARPALYTIEYQDKVGPLCGIGEWRAYSPSTTAVSADTAMAQLGALRLRFTKTAFRAVPHQPVKLTRDVLRLAVGHLAVGAGRTDLKPKKMRKAGLVLAASYLNRMNNSGNRLAKPNGTLSQDGKGNVVIRMGGAR